MHADGSFCVHAGGGGAAPSEWCRLEAVRFKQPWLGTYPPRRSADGRKALSKDWRPLPPNTAPPPAKAVRQAAVRQAAAMERLRQQSDETVDESGAETDDDDAARRGGVAPAGLAAKCEVCVAVLRTSSPFP